jgi:prlF antitoxin for toxin YhaV_toxin
MTRRSTVAKLKAGVRHKKREHAVARVRDAGVYHGKQAKTGNSLGLRFERALFHSHPEFNGEVEAHVIAPGRMLVVADPGPRRKNAEEDPVLSSFMSFLAADMQRFPENITALDGGVMEHIGRLVRDVNTSPEEDLGDEALI